MRILTPPLEERTEDKQYTISYNHLGGGGGVDTRCMK